MYANDIVCLFEFENDQQEILGIIENWCKKWRLEIDLTKTNILHIRKGRKQQSKFTFLFGMKPVIYCQYYKYLGVNINGYIDFKFKLEKDTNSSGRALGVIISKMIQTVGFHLKFIKCCSNYYVSSITITIILLPLSGCK